MWFMTVIRCLLCLCISVRPQLDSNICASLYNAVTALARPVTAAQLTWALLDRLAVFTTRKEATAPLRHSEHSFVPAHLSVFAF